MAKKGSVQQLQADIQTDEELERFMDRPGLLVLDVYSDWCGPCLGMLGTLKKIKLEIGGDNLHLAICKADGVTFLQRFRRKSEPTWLFVINGRAVNILFGTNVPKLTDIISKELRNIDRRDRIYYNIQDYQPIELEKKKIKEDAQAEAERIELAAKEKKRTEYLTYVTDTIMDGLPDIGITLFGPQVNRDMFKKISEIADTFKIQCKDRKMTTVTKQQFDVINFKCPNALPPEVIEQLDGKDLLICFWKVPGEGSDVPNILRRYATDLMAPRTSQDPQGPGEEPQTPILSSLEIKVEVELDDDEEIDDETEAFQTSIQKSHKALLEEMDTAFPAEDEYEEEDDEGYVDFDKSVDVPGIGLTLGIDEPIDEEEEEEYAKPTQIVQKKRTRTKLITVPPIWTPHNQRTHAALIYVFFRNATTTFLPPDPVPEPPHIIMSFDTYKRKDLIAHAHRHKEDVPAYGFFSSDDPDDAIFIANSEAKYATKTHSPTDKLIFKVNKSTSNTMLSLVTYGPSYVSPNTVIGREEAKKFFPESYMSAEEEFAENLKLQEAQNKTTAKAVKKVEPEETVPVPTEAPEANPTMVNITEYKENSENWFNASESNTEDIREIYEKVDNIGEDEHDNEEEFEATIENSVGVTFAENVET